jgi:hypothetical protein
MAAPGDRTCQLVARFWDHLLGAAAPYCWRLGPKLPPHAMLGRKVLGSPSRSRGQNRPRPANSEGGRLAAADAHRRCATPKGNTGSNFQRTDVHSRSLKIGDLARGFHKYFWTPRIRRECFCGMRARIREGQLRRNLHHGSFDAAERGQNRVRRPGQPDYLVTRTACRRR